MTRMAKTTRAPQAREGVRYHLEDPYIPRGGWSEPTVCPVCSCVYSGKKWGCGKKLLETAKKNPSLKYAKCPGCRKVEDRYAMGIVELSGDFLLDHKKDIISAIKGEEKHARGKNPLERIISIEDKGEHMTVETTSDQLALRLGRHLHSTYSGKVDYKFTPGEKSVRVFWFR